MRKNLIYKVIFLQIAEKIQACGKKPVRALIGLESRDALSAFRLV